MQGDAAGNWTTSFPNGPTNIPLQVRVQGDSLITESAEYESVLRPGVRVTVRTASVRRGDELHGNVVATYRAADGQEQVPGTILATRLR
jgi:hypothetical protein